MAARCDPRIHARITPDAESGSVATGEEIAVVTQGETLDEVTAHLREAAALHLEGEDLAPLGSPPNRPSS